MNAALLRDGAENPSGFWLRYALRRAADRLRVHAVVALLPVAVFSGLFWKVGLGEKTGMSRVVLAAAATAAAAAALHVLLGALLDLVCETSRFGAVLQRETMFYFHTPVPYLVLVLFNLLSGWFFYATLALGPSGSISFRPTFQITASFLMFLVPILTIRSFADEKATGTVEPLLTAPVSETHVVAGKFLGAMAFFLAMLLPTVAYFAILRFLGASIGKPDAGPVIAGYAGMVLFGAFHVAIGIFASTLTQDAILGAFLSFVLTLLFWVAEPILQSRPLMSSQGWNDAAQYLTPIRHLEPFLKGVLPPVDVLYFLTFILFFLFLAVRSIEYRKWR